MFERIKKAFGKPAQDNADGPPSSLMAQSPMSEWAATQGFAFTQDSANKGVALEGKVGGHKWRIQLGKPSRNYIFGEEVRARAELGIDEQVAVLVMNRPLKEALEKRAFQIYTDGLQTSVDQTLPEEMRWLSMFEEIAWEALPEVYWKRYAVLSDRPEQARAWIDVPLAQSLMKWPAPGPSAEVPFIMLLLNGKAYLRMEYTPADLSTLQHASYIFTSACEAALAAFGARK